MNLRSASHVHGPGITEAADHDAGFGLRCRTRPALKRVAAPFSQMFGLAELDLPANATFRIDLCVLVVLQIRCMWDLIFSEIPCRSTSPASPDPLLLLHLHHPNVTALL